VVRIVGERHAAPVRASTEAEHAGDHEGQDLARVERPRGRVIEARSPALSAAPRRELRVLVNGEVEKRAHPESEGEPACEPGERAHALRPTALAECGDAEE